MTSNQIAYSRLQEDKRANLASEAIKRDTLAETMRANRENERIAGYNAWISDQSRQETARHNLAYETETNRSNLARELETNRHNIQTEAIQRQSNYLQSQSLSIQRSALAETIAHNRATESETHRSNMAKEDETRRSNMIKETETERHNRSQETIGYWNAINGSVNAFSNAVGTASNVLKTWISKNAADVVTSPLTSTNAKGKTLDKRVK